MKRLGALAVFGFMFLFGASPFAVGVTVPDACADGGLPVSVGMDNAFLSRYVWRGLDVTDDPVWEPSAWLSYKGLTLNVWGNMDMTGVNGNEGEINEVDYTVDYSFGYEKLGFSVGGIHYTFPNTGFNSTSEIYGSVGYDTILQPTLGVYYDFDQADGFYGTFGLSHSFEVPKVVDGLSAGLDLGASLGFASGNWNNFYYGSDKAAFVDLTVSAGLPVAVGGYLTVAPSVSYSTVVDGGLRSGASNNHNIIWGVTVSAAL